MPTLPNLPTAAANRRDFLRSAAAGAVALAASGLPKLAGAQGAKRDYQIAVDGWTFHREVASGKIKQVDLFKVVREEYEIGAFNLVNNMLEVPTADYVKRLDAQAKKAKVEIPLIMIDSEGAFGSPKAEEREKAVRNHTKWVWIASDLGCKRIRVNWHGAAKTEEKDLEKGKDLIARSAEAYGKLVEIAKQNGLDVIIENHWGPSSYPDMLVALMKAVNSPSFGILPDFGNFPPDVDRYDAVEKFMPYTKAVSAKCYDFDDKTGLETKIDFERMVQICVDKGGYHGWMGVEFEGDRLSEREGLKRGRDLLIKLRG